MCTSSTEVILVRWCRWRVLNEEDRRKTVCNVSVATGPWDRSASGTTTVRTAARGAHRERRCYRQRVIVVSSSSSSSSRSKSKSKNSSGSSTAGLFLRVHENSAEFLVPRDRFSSQFLGPLLPSPPPPGRIVSPFLISCARSALLSLSSLPPNPPTPFSPYLPLRSCHSVSLSVSPSIRRSSAACVA